MGGKALKSTETRRYERGEYFIAAKHVCDTLNENGWSTTVIPAYRSKESFGDLDIVVQTIPNRDIEETVIAAFAPNECIRNGDVLSFNYNDLQVDLIMTAPEDVEFSIGYFSWNDLGNFIGRTAHRLGFKFGHDGLWYSYRDPEHTDRMFREICLTKDFDAALEFLGFAPGVFSDGFYSPAGIFAYAASSKYFDPAQFLLHNRSYAARKRDSTRKMYENMLTWILARYPDLNEESKPMPADRAFHLGRAKAEWPKFADDLYQAELDLQNNKALQAVFNGDVIGALFDREGKELGILMKNLREYFTKHELLHWVRSRSADQFKEFLYFLELTEPLIFAKLELQN